MAFFLIVILVIAMLHCVYDGIILPSIRQRNRNRLFAFRDELRWMMIAGEINNEDIAAFNLMHDSINIFVNRLPMLTVTVQKSFEHDLQSNKRLKKIIDDRRKMIRDCKNSRIKRISREINTILENTYIVNGAGRFTYLIPLLIMIMTLKKVSSIFDQLAITPIQEVLKIIPNTENRLCY